MTKEHGDGFARIKVIGVGGAGGNAINRMIEAQLAGVEFLAANTDVQALGQCVAEQKLQLGESVTHGLGAGGDPETGLRAAEESRQEIKNALEAADMVFVTGGMGGGTGTGASPVVAEVARELGALTVAVVSKPFAFERGRRMNTADEGLTHLRAMVDTLITIPNDRLLGVAEKQLPLVEAFNMANNVLYQGVQGVSDLITLPGLINLDFADIKTIMANAGPALMGIGTGTGENRAGDAANAAISSPLLEQPIDGARRILFNITGPKDLALSEVEQAAEIIAAASEDQETNVLFGVVMDESMKEDVRITVVATGFGPTSPMAQTISQSMQETLPQPSTEEADLEIPAFLRKR
jgi:cell division protein FtsZ